MPQFLCVHLASVITCIYKIRYSSYSYSSTAFKSQEYAGINNYKRLKHYLRYLKGGFSSKNWIALCLTKGTLNKELYQRFESLLSIIALSHQRRFNCYYADHYCCFFHCALILQPLGCDSKTSLSLLLVKLLGNLRMCNAPLCSGS